MLRATGNLRCSGRRAAVLAHARRRSAVAHVRRGDTMLAEELDCLWRVAAIAQGHVALRDRGVQREDGLVQRVAVGVLPVRDAD